MATLLTVYLFTTLYSSLCCHLMYYKHMATLMTVYLFTIHYSSLCCHLMYYKHMATLMTVYLFTIHYSSLCCHLMYYKHMVTLMTVYLYTIPYIQFVLPSAVLQLHGHINDSLPFHNILQYNLCCHVIHYVEEPFWKRLLTCRQTEY
jgi:hypothetical protein